MKARLGIRGSVVVGVRSPGPGGGDWREHPLASRSGETLRSGPTQLKPGTAFQKRLTLDAALPGTFPVVEEVTGVVR